MYSVFSMLTIHLIQGKLNVEPFVMIELQLRQEGRVANVADVVSRGQKVKVKVLSITGTKISLSIKVNMVFLVIFFIYN